MIQFANAETTSAVRSMWKECFGDTKVYMDLFFSEVYRPENTLIYVADSRVVSSLQMLPYSFRFCGEVFPFFYLAGLCTLPEYRGKGIMNELINASFGEIKTRETSLSMLLPAEDWLYGYYERFGYVQTFKESERMIDLSPFYDLFRSSPDLAYEKFNKDIQSIDCIVLKDKHDFDIIMSEFSLDHCLHKYSLPAMIKIDNFIDFFSAISKIKLDLYITMKVDYIFQKKEVVYEIKNGAVNISNQSSYDLCIDDISLAKLILGFESSSQSSVNRIFNLNCRSIVNLMLE